MSISNKIKVIVPFYNPGDFLELCVNSVLTQNYDNFEVVFIDDSSNDGAAGKYIPQQLPLKNDNGEAELDENGNQKYYNSHPILDKTKCKKTMYWRSNQYMGSVTNIHQALINFCEEDSDIAFIINGHGYLSSKNVLKEINDIFENNKEIELVYGSEKGLKDIKYDKEDFARGINKSEYKLSYPIAFKKNAYVDLLKKDPECSFSKDFFGNFLKYKFEVVTMFPILNMLGEDKVFHNNKEFYFKDKDYYFDEDILFSEDCIKIYKEVYEKK